MVEWDDNTSISDQSPDEYVSEYESRFSEDELTEMYKHHALPHNWQTMEYNEFLEERRKLMAQVVREGYEQLKV